MFLKNKNIIFKIRRSKVTDYAALKGRYDPNKYHYKQRAIIDPPAKRHLMAFHWRADDDPTLNAGLVTLQFFRGSALVLLESPLFFVIIQGGPDPLYPLWIRP